MLRGERGLWLARLFWIVACGDVLFLLTWILDGWTHPSGEFAGLAVFVLLVFLGIVGAIIGVVALIRNRVAYAIGLTLVAWPPLLYGGQFITAFAITPSDASLEAGHGYFSGAANRALADAIVAGDSAKVASLAPTADVNVVGWDRMTFTRLALENGHAKPETVAALLKAGLNPDQDDQLLFGFMTESETATGVMVKEKNEPLLRAVIDAGVDLNQLDMGGYPRYFSLLRWPEGLALALDHGARAQVEDKDGNTAIMWAVMLWDWPSIDVLLAHGARTDHVAHDGRSLRDIVLEMQKRQQNNMPPELVALEARLR